MSTDSLVIIQFTLLAAGLTGGLVVLQIAQDQYSHAVMRLLLRQWRVILLGLLMLALPVTGMFLAGWAPLLVEKLLTAALTAVICGWAVVLLRSLSAPAIAGIRTSDSRLLAAANFGVATGCARRFDFTGAQSAVVGYFRALPPAGRWKAGRIEPEMVAGQMADMLVLALREGDRNVVARTWLVEFSRWFSDPRNLSGADRAFVRVPFEVVARAAMAAEPPEERDLDLAQDLADALIRVGAAYARLRKEPPFDYGLALAAIWLKRLEAWPPHANLWKGGQTAAARVRELTSRHPELVHGSNILVHAAGQVPGFARASMQSPESACLLEVRREPEPPRDWEPTSVPGLYIRRGWEPAFEPPPGAVLREATVTDRRLVQPNLELADMLAARTATGPWFE